jgi:hypothetical protein
MKPKLILGLALVLSGYCQAAIIFPKAPDGGKQVAAKYLDPKVLKGLRIKNYENLTIGEPMTFCSCGDLVSGKFLPTGQPWSWQYPLMDGTNAVGYVELNADNTFSSSGTSPFDNEVLEATRMAEDLPQVKKQDYELRCLDGEPFSFFAVWLHGKTNDIIIPLPPTYNRMNAYQPYSENQIIEILAPEAKRVGEMWAKLYQQRQHDQDAYAKAMTDYEKTHGDKCGIISFYGESSPFENPAPNVHIFTLLGKSIECGNVSYKVKVTYKHDFDNVKEVKVLEKLPNKTS